MTNNLPDDLAFRPFGRLPEDLELDFDQASRPHLVTRLLWLCARNGHDEHPEPAAFWTLTVGARVASLLKVAACGGAPSFTVPLTCLNTSCSQQMEVELSAEELVEQHGTAQLEAAIKVCVDEATLLLRRPTGRDQRQWQQQAFDDVRAARDAIIRTLLEPSNAPVAEGPIPDKVAEAIGEAMQAFDPLVNYSFGIRCPYCKEGHTYEIDLEEIVLHHLAQAQRNLLHQIHHLARCYHWSEPQILALSPRRRARYLALIDREEPR